MTVIILNHLPKKKMEQANQNIEMVKKECEVSRSKILYIKA